MLNEVNQVYQHRGSTPLTSTKKQQVFEVLPALFRYRFTTKSVPHLGVTGFDW